ncbi:VOC family protein [Bradyrhizobium australiense]|uniref:Glyoxalase/fosfomycin resistance/dioxygenase domain-containing protein n=1 Tax=Bradyrhizobium australiense TaxID=2721161 RepID=A0A7Y4GPR0_9BRAD|nr:VOC family protein [Bradyrhizobium australiense]NOJ39699.1 hypothetical protein [Bradyrhizobium australiense]
MKKIAPGAVMPIITVESVDTERNFYVEKLGFDHVMGVVGKDGEFDFVTVVKDGARIMFARAPALLADQSQRLVEIYLEVSDVEVYFRQLQKKRVNITNGGATVHSR